MKIKTLIVNEDSLIRTKNHLNQWTSRQQINMDTEVSVSVIVSIRMFLSPEYVNVWNVKGAIGNMIYYEYDDVLKIMATFRASCILAKIHCM